MVVLNRIHPFMWVWPGVWETGRSCWMDVWRSCRYEVFLKKKILFLQWAWNRWSLVLLQFSCSLTQPEESWLIRFLLSPDWTLQRVVDDGEEGAFLLRLDGSELRCRTGNKVFRFPLRPWGKATKEDSNSDRPYVHQRSGQRPLKTGKKGKYLIRLWAKCNRFLLFL